MQLVAIIIYERLFRRDYYYYCKAIGSTYILYCCKHNDPNKYEGNRYRAGIVRRVPKTLKKIKYFSVAGKYVIIIIIYCYYIALHTA